MVFGVDKDKAGIITEIHSTLQNLQDLPTLPNIAIETRRMVNDPSFSMNKLTRLIESDLALTGRVLRVANSAYYGIPRKVDNLKMALVILGSKEISDLVTTISILRIFDKSTISEDFNIKEFWIHSAGVAELTVALFEGLRMVVPGSAYTAGLLHDIGKLILNQYFTEYHTACLVYSAEKKIRIVEVEVELLGIDHGHIGSWLTKRWNVPDDITDAIAKHHIRPPDSNKYSLPVFIDWADRLYYVLIKRDREKAKKLLSKSQGWQKWLGDKSHLSEKIIELLYDKYDRATTLVNLLD